MERKKEEKQRLSIPNQSEIESDGEEKKNLDRSKRRKDEERIDRMKRQRR